MSVPVGAVPESPRTSSRNYQVRLERWCTGAAVLGAGTGALAALWWPQIGVHVVLLVLTLGVGVRAAVVDLREHRLPDRITWPYAAAATGMVVASAIMGNRVDLVVNAVLGSVATAGMLYVLALFASMGLGDVKYGLGLGVCAGAVGVPAAAVLPIVAMLLAAPVAVVMWVRHGASTRLPMGPALGAAGSLICLGPFLP